MVIFHSFVYVYQRVCCMILLPTSLCRTQTSICRIRLGHPRWHEDPTKAQPHQWRWWWSWCTSLHPSPLADRRRWWWCRRCHPWNLGGTWRYPKKQRNHGDTWGSPRIGGSKPAKTHKYWKGVCLPKREKKKFFGPCGFFGSFFPSPPRSANSASHGWTAPESHRRTWRLWGLQHHSPVQSSNDRVSCRRFSPKDVDAPWFSMIFLQEKDRLKQYPAHFLGDFPLLIYQNQRHSPPAPVGADHVPPSSSSPGRCFYGWAAQGSTRRKSCRGRRCHRPGLFLMSPLEE